MSPEALQCIFVSALPWHRAPSFSSRPLGKGFNPMQCALPMAWVSVLLWLCVCNERARLCCLWSEVLRSCCMLPHVRLGIYYCVSESFTHLPWPLLHTQLPVLFFNHSFSASFHVFFLFSLSLTSSNCLLCLRVSTNPVSSHRVLLCDCLFHFYFLYSLAHHVSSHRVSFHLICRILLSSIFSSRSVTCFLFLWSCVLLFCLIFFSVF